MGEVAVSAEAARERNAAVCVWGSVASCARVSARRPRFALSASPASFIISTTPAVCVDNERQRDLSKSIRDLAKSILSPDSGGVYHNKPGATRDEHGVGRRRR